MKVYLLYMCDYETSHVIRVYESQADAERACKIREGMPSLGEYGYFVREAQASASPIIPDTISCLVYWDDRGEIWRIEEATESTEVPYEGCVVVTIPFTFDRRHNEDVLRTKVKELLG